MSSIMVPAHGRKEIEKYVETIKDLFGLDKSMYIPVLKIAELIIPQFDSGYSFVPVFDCELENNEYAKYIPESNELLIKESVYCDACQGNPRHRFTIAHELGHYFLHGDTASFSRCSDTYKIPAYANPEWQANVFAGAFLISPKLTQGMTASQIAQECGVSYEAASIAVKTNKKELNATHIKLFS